VEANTLTEKVQFLIGVKAQPCPADHERARDGGDGGSAGPGLLLALNERAPLHLRLLLLLPRQPQLPRLRRLLLLRRLHVHIHPTLPTSKRSPFQQPHLLTLTLRPCPTLTSTASYRSSTPRQAAIASLTLPCCQNRNIALLQPWHAYYQSRHEQSITRRRGESMMENSSSSSSCSSALPRSYSTP
jgi:hypothetical protein